MKCRMSVADMTTQDKAEYVQAVLDLKNPSKSPSMIPEAAARVIAGGGTPNRYDDYVYIHSAVGNGAHNGAAFGPWHREFLRQFEHDLQQVSGKPELTIPYWDWTAAQAPDLPGWPFTDDFLGGFGNAQTGIVTSGRFADPATWRVSIRLPNDPVVTLKRFRGIPEAAKLPKLATARFALGEGVPAGLNFPIVYDAAPFNGAPQGTPEEVAALRRGAFRKFFESFLHNGVHGWVGGAWDEDPVTGFPRDGGHLTFVGISVNDPAFFLHHCNVDRMWATWQRKAGTPAYVPVTGATAGHNAGDVMVQLGRQSDYNLKLLGTADDHHNHQAVGPWYRSDVPEITAAAPFLDFGKVPAGLTVSRPVLFAVRTCQPVTFRIASVTGEGFSIPAGQGDVVVDRVRGGDLQMAKVPVALTADGAQQTGSVTIEATIVDRDGFYTASPGQTRKIASFTTALQATPAAAVPGDELLVAAPEPEPLLDEVPAPVPDDRELVAVHATHPAAAPDHDDHGHDDHGHDDHDHHHHDTLILDILSFDARTGESVKVKLSEIRGDTSGFDEDGNDPGVVHRHEGEHSHDH